MVKIFHFKFISKQSIIRLTDTMTSASVIRFFDILMPIFTLILLRICDQETIKALWWLDRLFSFTCFFYKYPSIARLKKRHKYKL